MAACVNDVSFRHSLYELHATTNVPDPSVISNQIKEEKLPPVRLSGHDTNLESIGGDFTAKLSYIARLDYTLMTDCPVIQFYLP